MGLATRVATKGRNELRDVGKGSRGDLMNSNKGERRKPVTIYTSEVMGPSLSYK